MAGESQFALLGQRRFLPFFLTQALGAFNDNVFRYGVVLLVGFQLALDRDMEAFYIQLAMALFILPFFLFSAFAGQLAEKYEKARLIRLIKLAEVFIMLLAAVGFWFKHVPLLLGVVFLMGLQSTLFGPIKYAILPQVLHNKELTGGNGLVETGTALAILAGMMLGGSLMAMGGAGPSLVSAVVIAMALAGYLASRAIPAAPATDPGLRFQWEPLGATWQCLRFMAAKRTVFLSVLGISWFWFYGGVFTAQLPLYTKYVLGGDESVSVLVLTLFSVGIALGSLLCEKLSGRRVEIGLVPFGAIGMTLFAIDVYFARSAETTLEGIGWLAFLAEAGNWRLVVDFLLIGMFAGFYIVPLFALVQSRSNPAELSRIIAGNNILNALFIVLAAGFGIAMGRLGFSVPEIFFTVALLNALVAVIIFRLVPEFLMRFLVWMLVSVLYRIRAEGLDRIPERGPALVVCNHVSFIDALILGGMVRRPIRFVMYHRIFRIPVLSFIFRTARAIPIAPAKEDPELMEKAFDDIDAALAAGDVVGIFPEGEITRDGAINPFRPGVERILERRPVPVIPIALRGLWGSVFSRRDTALGRMRFPRRFRARIGLAVGEPREADDATAAALEADVRELRGDAA
jgi:1-acyl-sn-glycerol-3-phosphate acyltransferase